jgi:hypothetical protein
VVSYPFHPLAGQSIFVVGDQEHDGIHYALIRKHPGGCSQVPAWMLDPAVASLKIVSVPRFPVSQLILLRSLVDRLLGYSLQTGICEGIGDENITSQTTRSIHKTTRAARTRRRRAKGGDASSADASARSDIEAAMPTERQERGGGGQ